MDLQLVEAYVPLKYYKKIDESIRELPHVSYWISKEAAVDNKKILIRVLVETKHTEGVLNYLENVTNIVDGFEVMLLPVQTYITREKQLEQKEKQKKDQKEEKEKIQILRASRHELYDTIQKSSKIHLNFTLLVILSALVVTIGFIKNSPAIVIGAMVIAPMLGPVISIAFSSILGDYPLVWRSTGTLLFAIFIVLVISTCFGYFYIPMNSSEFWSRTMVDITDIILGLASGAAGALSILNRLPGALVGVMVAVALLPPTVVLGMTMGATMWTEVLGASLLLSANISSILLSAIIVFSLSGIRPVKWEEVQRARTSRTYSILFVTMTIIILVATILFSNAV